MHLATPHGSDISRRIRSLPQRAAGVIGRIASRLLIFPTLRGDLLGYQCTATRDPRIESGKHFQ
jgi:hypothetical protein